METGRGRRSMLDSQLAQLPVWLDAHVRGGGRPGACTMVIFEYYLPMLVSVPFKRSTQCVSDLLTSH
jgi:hypothetical protein